MPTKTRAKQAPQRKARPSALKPVKKPALKSAPRPSGKPVVKAASKPAGPASKVSAAPAAPAFSTADQQRSLTSFKQFFDRTLSCLDESDSGFTPAAGMFSAAQQVAHVAQTTDWFREGAFNPKGFNMDFAGMEGEVRKVTSLAAARTWHDAACARLMKALKEQPASEWLQPIVKETIMGGAPRLSIIDGLADHTGHHRGSLAVYARLRGKVPAMPYM